MIIEPWIRDNVCLNAHPEGCFRQVEEQVRYVTERGPIDGPKRVLVIGASNGYGLATRIVSTFGSGASTVGVAYERPAKGKRTASAGWYNNEAFTRLAREKGYVARNINGDAFSIQIKKQVSEAVRESLGALDFLVYSIAAPRREDPETGDLYSSVIKPIGQPYSAKTVDFLTGQVQDQTSLPATPEEVAHTIKVMGGEDWSLWIEHLLEADLLAGGFQTIAFSYIGPEITRPIYRDGTIGRAKEDLERHVQVINRILAPRSGRAVIGVQKALVTRASAVIPAVPLYISLLYQVMKAKGLHENCIQQIFRLYHDFLFSPEPAPTDDLCRLRLDDWEMRPDIQAEVAKRWVEVNDENVYQLADLEGFREEFLRHHGFGIPGIDYRKDVTLPPEEG
ncbi:MAG: trans-2-enoyl-CoA reductase family protein [Pirellulales bacterium]|nr:trans-2-enoyl-CoA reductase family protein [Pirellulales bacterium]